MSSDHSPRRSITADSGPPALGSLVPVRIESPVAGGRCVARHEGRIAFVRGALPDEEVMVGITGYGRGGSFLWAETVEVLQPSPDRVTPPCPVAGVCGGCDWQHATLDAQRRLKAEVIIDALKRTGGLTEIGGIALAESITVNPLDDGDGLGWRTRMRYATDGHGRIGLRAHESHRIIPAATCPLAVAEVRHLISELDDSLAAEQRTWPAKSDVTVAASASGEMVLAVEPADRVWADGIAGRLPVDVAIGGIRGDGWMTEIAAARSWRVRGDGFWQVHPNAAETLVKTVVDLCSPKPGDRVLDLFSGVGLFAGALASIVGPGGSVDAVERDRYAVDAARENLRDLPQIRCHRSSVTKWLARPGKVRHSDVVVLDPPRAGAGREAVEMISARQPRVIAYVACDPVALARDLKCFAGSGYQTMQVRAFDIFPMTKHVECIALLSPIGT